MSDKEIDRIREQMKDRLRVLLAGDRRLYEQEIEMGNLDEENNLMRKQLFRDFPDLMDDEIAAITEERDKIRCHMKALWLRRILDDYEIE